MTEIQTIPVKARGGKAEKVPVDAKKLVSGKPVTTTRNDFTNAKGKFNVGVWTSSKGVWNIKYKEDEFIVLLAGKLKLTGKDGKSKTYKAGDAFVIPKGFEGIWETLEPIRKYYAIAS